jgi:crotonyl-CoA carboxylase/reductase
MFVCDTGGVIVICAGTTGYNATIDLRYLWMRQKRFQGSHFANDEQCYAMNELALSGQLNPCMSRAFTYDELPLSHQLMHDNKHPHGNMSVLIGAPGFGLGKSAEAPVAVPRPTLPKDDLHDPKLRHPYPVSAPLPDVAAGLEGFEIRDDGSKVRERMSSGIISCRREDTLGQAGKTMIDNDIHALVVIEGDRAVGVLSQTDIVLARQGRTIEEARALTVGEIMTEGCATVEADEKLSVAITEMMKRRIHRLVVVENGKPVGVLSMTDIVRNLIG